MSPPRSLQAFLAAARSALVAPAGRRASPLTIVVGNESADLDSLCSAVLLAYLRSHVPPHTLHVPLSNLERADLRLRPELSAAMDGAVSADDLITLSELPTDLSPAETRWLLVDHNALTGVLAGRFAARVVGCIDHHADEGVVPDVRADDLARIIEPCGSCVSLVLRAHAASWRALATRQPDPPADRQLARLALAPLLVDTTGLRDGSKTTETDRQAVAVAESFLAAHDLQYDRSAYLDQLAQLKDNLAGLSYRDVLRKDYKQWREGVLTLGMATAVQGFEYLLTYVGPRDALLAAMPAFAAERGLDILAVMAIRHDNADEPMARQLLLWAANDTAAAVLRAFVRDNAQQLGLEPWDGGSLDNTGSSGEWRTCWWQRQTRFSRKQVAPLLREAMRISG
ncbi:exopolyphosphatase [Grosmannia clavigera kw1407]|uniref:Exopolyphosphatase n=1 Tax=Grosmannia clavigera (strain kw1407 / UAMH 11150) TaxID=655863 RepID=F0X892_GROCL|nr:exopolyphosphatase [Grosmannia clavigera kw1407]EFX05957.1 exopolyphosphatase [Grosmannia clavigera kw1407]